MRAGNLRYKLTLLEPQRTTDRMGAEATRYVETRTVWAERVHATGRRSEEVGEHFADYAVEFLIRDAHPIGENWRVRQLGGYLYEVQAIIPNRSRGYNQLVCERVNE